MADETLFLQIDLLSREVSKDSNAQREIVEVKNSEVSYQYKYTGYPESRKESSRRTLSDGELSTIIKHIKETGLNKAITEKAPLAANGPSRTVHLALRMSLDGVTTESKISGNYHIYRADGKITGVLIQNRAYVDSASTLIQRLK